jgi:TolB-like protein/tetratricopeptide (TPR) repeat protein
MSLFEELKRRKVFKVGVGYLVVAWLIVQVASIGFPAFDAPPWALRVFILVLLLGFPISLLFAWAFDVTPEGVKADRAQTGNKRFLLVTVVLIALAFAWYFKGQPTVRDEAPRLAAGTSAASPTPEAPKPRAAISKKSIAVLPFTDLSPGKDQEYFSDGISEEILNALAQVKDLKVAGRTSSFHFKGRNDDLRAIGEALGVAHILEGSVRKQGNKVRITAQLIQVEDGFHLWSESFDGDLSDVFELQERIARSITDKLQVILIEGQGKQLVAAPTQDIEAYTLYLQATQIFNRRDGTRWPEAIGQLEQALRLDPKFARAHSRLAALQALAGNYYPEREATASAAAENHARQAMALDPTMAEPWAALGALNTRHRRFVEAMEASDRALQLDPGDVTANFWNATLLCQVGYLERCSASLDRTLQLDPMLPNALQWRGRRYVEEGQLEAGEKLLQRSVDAGLAHAGFSMAVLAEKRGDLAAARKHTAEGFARLAGGFPPDSIEVLVRGMYGNAQERALAIASVDRYLAGKPKPVSAVAANAMLRLDPRRALRLFQDTATNNDSLFFGPLWLFPEAIEAPEFPEFARRSGLARAWDKYGAPDKCRRKGAGDYVCH